MEKQQLQPIQTISTGCQPSKGRWLQIQTQAPLQLVMHLVESTRQTILSTRFETIHRTAEKKEWRFSTCVTRALAMKAISHLLTWSICLIQLCLTEADRCQMTPLITCNINANLTPQTAILKTSQLHLTSLKRTWTNSSLSELMCKAHLRNQFHRDRWWIRLQSLFSSTKHSLSRSNGRQIHSRPRYSSKTHTLATVYKEIARLLRISLNLEIQNMMQHQWRRRTIWIPLPKSSCLIQCTQVGL